MKSDPITLKQPAKQSDFKYFRSLDDIPIWHWFQYHKKKDYKYLLKLDDYTQPISLDKDFKEYLNAIYLGMLFDLDEINLEIYQAKLNYQIALVEYIRKITVETNAFKDPETLDAGFKIITTLFNSDEPDYNYLFKIPLKDGELRKGLTDIARLIWEYRKIKDHQEPEQDLMNKIVRINAELKVDIDEKTCSVRKFLAYQKAYIEQINFKNHSVQ